MAIRTLIIIAIIAAVSYAGISIYTWLFKSNKTVDTRLADMAMKEILFQDGMFEGRIVNFEAAGEGEFRIDTQGIESAEEAGRIGYNALVVLDIQNIKLQSPRNVFHIEGYQNKELIFDIKYATNNKPVITLHGRFEGEQYQLPFTSVAPENFPENVSPEVRSIKGLA